MRPSVQALGRLPVGQMNKSEGAYASYLEARRIAGDIAWRKFEGMTFRLADNTRYTPDFNVMLPDGRVQMHEYKGVWADDARVKIKVAADLFPFQFVAVQRKAGGGYTFELF